MKISFLLYGLVQNGGNKVLIRVGNLLRQRGHDVSYFVAEPEHELPYPSDCQFVFAPVHFPNAIGRISWLAKAEIGAEVAIATSHHTAYSLNWNQSPIGRRLYYVQAYEPDFYSDSISRLARRWPMMLAAGASYLLPLEKMVNCEGSRRGLTWRDRTHAPELSPGIDLELYQPKPKMRREIVVGHIGRAEPWKGSDYFFRAIKTVRERGYNFRVSVAYDLWPHTHGVGYDAVSPRNESELASYYASLDVLVSTVTQKGFGYPPLEAMACGSLCISTPIDFGRPGVDHLPISAFSSESIVTQLTKALTVSDRKSFIAAGLMTASRYDWNVIADRWCALLEDAGRS